MLEGAVRDRVVAEQNELRDKITKLALFIYSERINTVSKEHASLLKVQLHVMEDYDEILTERLELD